MKHLITTLIISCISLGLQAGVFELSAQTSLKETNINSEHSSEAKSVSGSIAYYFWQSGALEFTHMTGYNFTKGAVSGSSYEQVLNYNYSGIDFIYNLGTRESTFNPYIKAGLAEINKELEYKDIGTNSITTQTSKGKNLTYGAGFKFKLSQTISFRVSYDVWKGPIDDSDQDAQTDSSFKVGLSWLL